MAAVVTRVESVRPVGAGTATSWDAAIFVWGVWSVLLLANLTFIRKYGDPYPYYDDWNMTRALVGAEPVNFTWFWRQHEEHRIPVPRLVWLVLAKVTNLDFRSGMYFNSCSLGVLALAMILAAGRLRGRTSYADAFFPLVLLPWGGPGSPLTWGFLVQLVSSTVLAGMILVIMVRADGPLSVRQTFWAGVCLVLLPLCGANGLGLVPVLAVWLLVACYGPRFLGTAPDDHAGTAPPAEDGPGRPAPVAARRVQRVLTLGFAGIALLLVPLYFYGLERGSSPPNTSLWTLLGTAAQFWSMSVAQGISDALDIGVDVIWEYVWGPLLGLTCISLVTLVMTGYYRPRERLRAASLLLFLGAYGCIALGIGHGRGGWWPEGGLQSRYVVLGAPVLCWMYLTWVMTRTAAGQFVQMSLFVLMAATILPTIQKARTAGRETRERVAAFEKDLAAGVPAPVLSQRHRELLFPEQEPVYMADIAAAMQVLHDKGIGKFRLLKPDPACVEVPGPMTPSVLSQVTWTDGVARGSTGESSMVFALEKPQPVYAVRLRGSYKDGSDAPVILSVSWKRSGQSDFSTPGQNVTLKLGPVEQQEPVMVWVDSTIDQIQIQPDNKPFVFALSEMMLLVPEAAGQSSRDASVPVYEPGTRLNLGRSSSYNYLTGAWFGPEGDWQWSGPRAGLQFRLDPVRPLRLRMMATTFHKQRVVISLNGREIQTLECEGDGLQLMEADLAPDALAETNTLTFTLPDAKTPASQKEGDDGRLLGLGVGWLELVPPP